MERKVYERHIKIKKITGGSVLDRNLISVFIEIIQKKIEDFGLWLWKRNKHNCFNKIQ